jgi:zinc protease
MSHKNIGLLVHSLMAFLLIFLGQTVFAQADTYTQETTLANGLKVIVREDHRSPTVAHMVWYKTGSIDETTGTTGVAHVLEHMMFKGTKKIGPGEFSKRVAAVGGRENAFTNNDYTAYFQQIEKSHLEEMMQLESDRMQNLVLSEDEFKKEIQVVMEERRLRTDDQANGLLYEQFMATAFNAAPNRNPVIGWMDDLKNMTYVDAQNWYHKWYTPSNAVLVVVGDVKPSEVFQMAARTYGKVPNQVLENRKIQGEPEQKGIRRFILKAPAENTLIFMGWKAPKVQEGNIDVVDPWALEVLSGILDGNQNSRLNRSLVINKNISNSVGASYDSSSRGEQVFFISGSLLPGKTPTQFETEIKSVIADIVKNGVEPKELQRVKIAVTSAQVYKRDSVFGQAMEIGSNEIVGNSWKKIDLITEKIQAVTAEQVKAVAQKYFIDDHLTIGVLDPQPIDPAKKLANEKAAANIQR